MRWLSLLSCLALLACDPAADDATTSDDGSNEGEVVDPPFDVRGDAEGLLLTWYDEEGQHNAGSRGEIPEPHRERVRVDSLSLAPDERDPDSVYVADLRSPGDDGRYEVRRYGRDAFDRVVDEAMGVAPLEPREPPTPGTPTQQLASSDVVIYGADWCSACRAAARYLEQREVPFVERNVEREPGARDEMNRKARAAGFVPSGIPVIDFRGTILSGFDQRRIDRLIRETQPRTI